MGRLSPAGVVAVTDLNGQEQDALHHADPATDRSTTGARLEHDRGTTAVLFDIEVPPSEGVVDGLDALP
jgi:hypothetical protein